MQQALVYYYFNDFGTTAYDDLQQPVVLSIASFRNFDKTTPIYVIDVSDQEQEWLDFPKKLDFTLFRNVHALKHCENVVQIPERHPISLTRLSKPIDIFELTLYCNQETIVVCDADVLFSNNLWPLQGDFSRNFCYSDGLFYFDKSSLNTEKIFEAWGNMCMAAAINPLMQRRVLESSPYKYSLLDDRACWSYLSKRMCHSIEKVSIYENFPLFSLLETKYDTEKIKGFHLMHHRDRCNIKREERGKLALHFMEIRRHIVNTLVEEDFKAIFKGFDCEQFSMQYRNMFLEIMGDVRR